MSVIQRGLGNTTTACYLQPSTGTSLPADNLTNIALRHSCHKPDKESVNGSDDESGLKSVPCIFIASSLHPYQSCVADPSPTRVIHYPNLNACLVHEGRQPVVDCKTAHFGYAIPVKIVPAATPDAVEVVFDSEAELDPHTAGYLLNHHPDLIAVGSVVPPLATPVPSVSALNDPVASSDMPVDPNEVFQKIMLPGSSKEQDIQAIAQQISDHAEVIYQTWKAKGLSPVELLQYHNTVLSGRSPASVPNSPITSLTSPSLAPSVASSKTAVAAAEPSPKVAKAQSGASQPPSKLSPVDLLASPSLEVNLEVLVNNFVQEDKARLARQRNSPARSVRSVSPSNSTASAPSPPSMNRKHDPKAVRVPEAASQAPMSPFANQESTDEDHSPNPTTTAVREEEVGTTAMGTLPSPTFQSAVHYARHKNPRLEDPLTGDTVKLRAARFAKQVDSQDKAPGIGTWPLEKGLVEHPPTFSPRKSIDGVKLLEEPSPIKVATKTYSSTAAANSAASQVDQEEQRLINALKSGRYPEESTEKPDFLRSRSSEIDNSMAPTQKVISNRWSAPYGRLVSAPSAYLGEEELETLVDKLRSLQNQNDSSSSRASSLGRELPNSNVTNSPRFTRENSPSKGQVPKLSDSVPPNLSAVNYAKVRYQNAQAYPLTQQRMEENRIVNKKANMTANLVMETRHRFENGQVNIPDSQWRSEWVPGRHQQQGSLNQESVPGPRVPESNAPPQETPEFANILRKKGRKSRKVPETDGPGTATPAALPHPELTVQQKQHLRERSIQQQQHNENLLVGAGGQGNSSCGIPIRPFLTRGSVAERVLLFEKAPSAVEFRDKTGFLNLAEKRKTTPVSWNSSSDIQIKTQNYSSTDKENRPLFSETSLVSPGSTLRREAKTNPRNNIPKFHFPFGRPILPGGDAGQVSRIAQAFQALPGNQATRQLFGKIVKVCGVPLYWKVPLFLAAGGEKLGYLTSDVFLEFWQKITRQYHDEASRFMFILTSAHPSKEINKSPNSYLLPDYFIPLLQDVVESHPGLTFLKAASEFHSRYIHTVIARIFYCVNRSWSGRITLTELRHSNLLEVIRSLEEEEDINQITDYFSYEHFYVIYCKFWELDRDHDLFIDRKDLARHNEHALSSRIIDRIFSGAVTRGGPHRQGTLKQGQSLDRMSYTEFVWFLVAEEDKRHPTAIEYWFRCMDFDGDGYLSMYELEYFYEEQLQRMETLGIESLPFEDCLCQMLDMVRPAIPGKISLRDLRQCRLCPVFFDTFFNLDKFLDHEQRDPFACQTDPSQQISDWDRYAAEEYELLVAEESGSDQVDDIYCQDDGDADMTMDTFGDEHSFPVEQHIPLSSR